VISKRKKQYDPKHCIVFSQTKAPFGELSNMCAGFVVKVNGELIRTIEALYQACRYPHLPRVQEDILAERSPMTAKMVSRHYVKETREDWDKIRIEVMRWCLKVKTLQHWDVLREIFTKTDGKPIVEKSRKDDFWGAKETEKKTLKGANVLGQLLMEVRDRVLSDNKAPTVVLPPRIPNFLLLGTPITAIRKAPLKINRVLTKRERVMKTVFVLGAGASIHAGYPLASKMGGDLLEFMLNYKFEDDRFRSSAQNLTDIFGKTPNIEDLISELETKINSLRNAKTDDDRMMRIILVDARSHVQQMLREWFRVVHSSPARLYAQFAERIVKSGDTVITFNYDDSLDRELRRSGKWDLSTGYGFPFGKTEIPSAVPLLKLHGSINWLVSLGGGVTNGPIFVGPAGFMGGRPVIHTVDAEYLGYENFSGNTYPGGGSTLNMVLPGRNKQFYFDTSLGVEFKTFWDDLWSQGAHALKAANRLVICGYSMPKADGRARNLLFKHTNVETLVTVLSGADSERIANEFRDAGYENIEVLGRGYFEDLIEQEKNMIEIGDTVKVISSGEIRQVTGTRDPNMFTTQVGMDGATIWHYKEGELELVAKAPKPKTEPGFVPSRGIMD
jgi:ribA/ribD-fused uncharacterized protein